jgi:hypothetical protein
MVLSLANRTAMLATYSKRTSTEFAERGMGEPKVGGCRDIRATTALVDPAARIGKILSLPTAGEPGWDRTNDLLIKS